MSRPADVAPARCPAGRCRGVRGATSYAWLRAALLVALIALFYGIGHDIVGDLRGMASAEAQTAISLTVATALLVYIVLMALPFCPGIEIGLALLALGGREIAPLVYLATVVALVLAFVVGRFFPPGALVESLARLRLRRAAEALRQIAPLDGERRLQLLLGHGNSWLVRFLVRHRYLAVAIALNMPGNLLIGDGGGIALAAGFSRLFSLSWFALTVAVAVAPVPIVVLLAGS
jgi:hypothetical protein